MSKKDDKITNLFDELDDLRIKHDATTEDLHHMQSQYESAIESKNKLLL